MAAASEKEKHKCDNVKFKLRAVEVASRKSRAQAAREFKVDSKRIREWCKNKDNLIELKRKGKSSRKRIEGAGRKAYTPKMKEELFDWIVDLRGRHLRVLLSMIMCQALSLSSSPSFKANRLVSRKKEPHTLSENYCLPNGTI